MTYPAKTCDITRLVTQPKLVEKALSGHKTEQRRNGLYAYPGETFRLGEQFFVITEVEQQTLGQMTDQQAQAEGLLDMSSYRNLITGMHSGMSWDESHPVWVHRFRRLG